MTIPLHADGFYLKLEINTLSPEDKAILEEAIALMKRHIEAAP